MEPKLGDGVFLAIPWLCWPVTVMREQKDWVRSPSHTEQPLERQIRRPAPDLTVGHLLPEPHGVPSALSGMGSVNSCQNSCC